MSLTYDPAAAHAELRDALTRIFEESTATGDDRLLTTYPHALGGGPAMTTDLSAIGKTPRNPLTGRFLTSLFSPGGRRPSQAVRPATPTGPITIPNGPVDWRVIRCAIAVQAARGNQLAAGMLQVIDTAADRLDHDQMQDAVTAMADQVGDIHQALTRVRREWEEPGNPEGALAGARAHLDAEIARERAHLDAEAARDGDQDRESGEVDPA